MFKDDNYSYDDRKTKRLYFILFTLFFIIYILSLVLIVYLGKINKQVEKNEKENIQKNILTTKEYKKIDVINEILEEMDVKENERYILSNANETRINESSINQTTVNETRINESSINQTTVNETRINESSINQTTVNETRINESSINQSAQNESYILSIINKIINDGYRIDLIRGFYYELIDGPKGISLNNTGTIIWPSLQEDIGIHNLTIKVTDNEGYSAIYNFSIEIVSPGIIKSINQVWSNKSKSIFISSWTKTAKSGETMFIVGESLDKGKVFVFDGERITEARVLIEDNKKILVVIPEKVKEGTLWVWIEGYTRKSNIIVINNPEPWWIQPNRVDMGETIRIFGRNFGKEGDIIKIILIDKNKNKFEINGYVKKPNFLEFSINELNYSDFKVFIKEPKEIGFYGGLDIFLREKYILPDNMVNVLDFGAIPNDEKEDNKGFIDAINMINSMGGGKVMIPEGKYILKIYGNADSRDMMQVGAGRAIILKEVSLEGEGINKTTIEFEIDQDYNKSVFVGFALGNHSKLKNLNLVFNKKSKIPIVHSTFVDVLGDFSDLSEDITIENVKFDSEEIFKNYEWTERRIQHILFNCNYCSLINNTHYGGGEIFLRGKQIFVKGIKNYGTLGPDYRWGFLGPSLAVSAGGIEEVIIEDCLVKSRMPEDGGVITRLWVSGVNFGEVTHVYFGENKAEDTVVHPFGGTGENLLFEGGCRYIYKGRINLDRLDKLKLELKDPINLGEFNDFNYAKNFSVILKYQNKTPFTLVIIDGKGFGQIRKGWFENESVFRINKEFRIVPDETSKVLIDFSFNENIIYGNHFKAANNLFSSGFGILLFGKSSNNIISNNYINNYYQGYSDFLLGCGGINSQVTYFNEIIGNKIEGTRAGITTVVSGKGERGYIQSMGNIYRNNTIASMDISLPAANFETPLVGMGIIEAENYWRIGGSGGNLSLGHIYEFNNISNALEGIKIGPFADFLVLRNNSIADSYKGIIINESVINKNTEGNEIEIYPEIKKEFLGKMDYLCPNVFECHVWIKKGDYGEINTTSIQGKINLSSLEIGFYEINLTKGKRLDKLFIYVGDYKNFENLDGIWYCSGTDNLCNRVLNVNENISILRRMEERFLARYDVGVNNIYDTEDHYHTIDTYKDNTKNNTYLRVRAIREELFIKDKNLVDNKKYDDAVISFIKGSHFCSENISSIIIRLKEDENNYYEFKDNCENIISIGGWRLGSYGVKRVLKKVKNGVDEIKIEKLSAHKIESPVFLKKDGNLIKFRGWGDEMRIIDPNPLKIAYWEIGIANTVKKRNISSSNFSFDEAYTFTKIDNLYFEKGNDLSKYTYSRGITGGFLGNNKSIYSLRNILFIIFFLFCLFCIILLIKIKKGKRQNNF